MRPGTLNPGNRRQELAQVEGRPSAGGDLRQKPAFQLHVRRSVRMHPVLAAGVAALVFIFIVGYALTRKAVYTAESLIYVEPLEVRVLNDGSAGGYDPSRYDSYLQQQVQTVERADTLEAALAKMPPGVWSGPGEPTASAVNRLEGSLKVERVLNSYQLGIDVTAGSAVAAAAAANAVTEAYLEQGRKDEHARADQRLQLLNEERQRITDDMAQNKAEQATLGASLGVANPNGESGNPYDVQTAGLRSQLNAAREAHDAVAAQLASVSGVSGNGLDTAANELIVTDPGLVSIKQTLSQRRAVLSDQMAGLTPANPVYKQDQEEIAALDRSMDRATLDARARAERQLQDKLRLDLRRTADVEGRLNTQLAQQTAKATGAGPKLQRAAELQTDLQRLSTRYAAVDDAIRGLQLETGGPGQAHLSLAARVPDAPKASRARLMLLLALPLALLCGIAAAVVARKRDPLLYLASDLEDVLGFAPMCVLPSAGEVSAAAYDDFLLRLAGGMEAAYRHGGARSFVFTPVSVSGAADALLPRLCAKLQQLGFRVVCVPAEALLAVEEGAVKAERQQRPPVEEEPRVGDGMAATQLERLLRENELVLVQAPPLLGSALTEYAVRSADATILLVDSTRTDRADLRRAAVLLERLNPEGIGAVLEDMPLRLADSVFRDAVAAADRAPHRRSEPVPDLAQRARAEVASRSVRKSAAPLTSVQEPATQFAEEHSISAVLTTGEPFAAVPADPDSPPVIVLAEPAVQERAQVETAAEPVEHIAEETMEAASPELIVESPVESTVVTTVAELPIAAPQVALESDTLAADTWDWQTPASEPFAAPPPTFPPEGNMLSFLETSEARAPEFPDAGVPEHTALETAAPFPEDVPAPRGGGSWKSWTQADSAAAVPVARTPAGQFIGEAPGSVPSTRTDASRFQSESDSKPLFMGPSRQLDAGSQEPADKPLGWLRRIFGFADEPSLKIVPQEDFDEDVAHHAQALHGEGAELEPEAAPDADPLLSQPSVAAPQAGDQSPEPILHDEAVLDTPASDAVDLESISGQPLAPLLTGYASEEPAEPISFADQAENEVLTGLVTPPAFSGARELEQQMPAAHLHSTAVLPLPSSEQSAPEAEASLAPERAQEPLQPDVERPLTNAGEPSEDHAVQLPSLSFPRQRATPPLTLEAIPSMVSSFGGTRPLPQEHPTPLPPRPMEAKHSAQPHVEFREPPVPLADAPSRQSSQRAGLAKAAAQAAAEEVPPARASEGLSAMRKGAGLRKAVVRQEAALRSHAADAFAQTGQPGMSRRWAMLSRFERDEEHAGADRSAPDEAGKRHV